LLWRDANRPCASILSIIARVAIDLELVAEGERLLGRLGADSYSRERRRPYGRIA